tara:strand:+ start:6097 stop:6789 length:693 start_codon:yes stop_codon:yes gene_type:complete
MAYEMELPIKRSKIELLLDIKNAFKEYEIYKKNKIDKYKKIERLGEKSKESTTFLVVNKKKYEYAMKTFRKNKSSIKLKKEVEFQKKCFDVGISPKIIDTDTVSKFIVMEKLEKHLYDVIKEQNNVLTIDQQMQLINIYKKLDMLKIYHGDVNLNNFMLNKKNKIFIIDFGESREITRNLCTRIGTATPNLHIMSLGLVLNLKKMGCSKSSYKYLVKCFPEKHLFHFIKI